MNGVPAILWRSAEAVPAVHGRCALSWEATGVSIDSRTVERGDLFFALKGPKFDAHDFVAAALAAGAVAAVVTWRPSNVPSDAPLVLVEDPLAALGRLAQAARERSRAKRIGVTGSVGKTGTKEALRLVLGAQGPTHASAGSYNNLWGVPLTLARMPAETRFGVFEIGMNHPGEILPLTGLVRPQVAVVTAIEPAHTEFFPSVEAIADAKAEIFAGVPADGTAILNRDNPHFARLADHARRAGIARILGFGKHPQAWARLVDCSLHATCSAVTAVVGGQRIDYSIGAPGAHWVMNSLAVLAAVDAVGADVAAAASALSRVRPPKGRGERSRIAIAGGAIELIDESYNASPAAVRAALGVLAQAKPGHGGRRIAVLGDMRELGSEAAALHAGLAGDLLEAGVDALFAVGPLMAHLFEALPADRRGRHTATSADMVPALVGALRPGDVVLVKGSLGTRMAPVVEAIKALGRADGGEPLPRAANGN
jgi:UDP-N-acetylmuramoyl-tripeptide--D-alanyl-D-alanine ligase